MKDGDAEPWTSTMAALVEGIFELRSQQWQASQEALVVKNPPASAGDVRDTGSIPGSGRFSWRRAWQPTLVFLPEESRGQKSVVFYKL